MCITDRSGPEWGPPGCFQVGYHFDQPCPWSRELFQWVSPSVLESADELVSDGSSEQWPSDRGSAQHLEQSGVVEVPQPWL